MIGGLVGAASELGISYVCVRATGANSMCSVAAYVLHECLIEPVVDGISYTSAAIAFSKNDENKPFIDLCYEQMSMGKVICGIALTQLFQRISSSALLAHHDNKLLMGALSGVLGGIVAHNSYEYLTWQMENAFNLFLDFYASTPDAY